VNDIHISTFQEAIQEIHGAKSRFLARENVQEVFKGEPVWQGEVLIFELLDHPSARLCYAWEVDGEVTAVLGQWPIKSAQDAVRASIHHG
jgi:hypothetical protein